MSELSTEQDSLLTNVDCLINFFVKDGLIHCEVYSKNGSDDKLIVLINNLCTNGNITQYLLKLELDPAIKDMLLAKTRGTQVISPLQLGRSSSNENS